MFLLDLLPTNVQCLWAVRVPYFVSTLTWHVQSSQWSEVAAGICVGYIFVMRWSKRPKYAERLWTQRLFNCGVQHELHVDDCSGSRNLVTTTESDFEILLLKIGPGSQRKDTKFREAIPPSIRLAVALRYVASGDFSLYFSSTDFICFFCYKISRVTFLITFFLSAQCAFNKTHYYANPE